MGTTFAATSREFTLRYAGLSFYWAWVFLSFNSLDIVGGGGRSISFVHVASSATAMVMFALCAMRYRSLLSWPARRIAIMLVVCGLVATLGTFLYASPLFISQASLVYSGALITGLACSPIVLAWGVVYRGLDAHHAVLFTSMTFFGAAVIYAAVTLLGPAFSSTAVSLLPSAAAVTAVVSLRGKRSEEVGSSLETATLPSVAVRLGGHGETRELVRTALSWRVLIGLMAALFAYGGLRVYFSDIAPDVFSNPLLMAGTIALAALIFFVYGAFVSRTSLNLGILYRIALSVWALAFVLIALMGHGNAMMLFFMASLSSVLFEMLTWALLVEITRTTHFPALLVFAIGRLAVHVGIVLGELVAFALVDDVVVFAVVAVFILMISVGFTFADRDTTFAFENPTPSELEHLAGDSTNTSRKALEAGFAPTSESLMERIDALADTHGLSPREKEVFALWVTGHGSKYIQEKFVISSATVKTHVRHIYEKCDVHNRAELMSKLEEAR